jgi:hypothetical protein
MEFLDIQTLVRSIFLGGLYVILTKDDDTTLVNISRFSIFYLALFISSKYVGIDQNIITTAFTTKFIFTFLDDHIQKNSHGQNTKENTNDNSNDKK